MDEFPTTWEEVSNDTAAKIKTYRLRVPGGWLVLITDTDYGTSDSHFVANPDGKWVLSSS